MRAQLAVLVALATVASVSPAIAQQAAPSPGPIQPSEPMPLSVYTGTNRSGAPEDARQAQPVFAVVGAHLVSGRQEPGAGRLTLMDETNPQFSCQVGHRGPLVQLACTDGSEAQLRLGSIGCGRSNGGLNASLCIGFTARYAARRLTAAPGETVAFENGRLTLRRAGA